jgi:hypothetical protein
LGTNPQPGGDVEDGRARLGHQRRQQRGGQADRPQEIDSHHRLGRSDIPAGQVLDELDAGVVEHDIDVGVAVGQFSGHALNVGWVALIQVQVFDARVSASRGLQWFAASAGNGDAITQSV